MLGNIFHRIKKCKKNYDKKDLWFWQVFLNSWHSVRIVLINCFGQFARSKFVPKHLKS